MKKLILLLAVSLFSITGVFAQAWTVKVSWDANNCVCQGTGNSYFQVLLKIKDVANEGDFVYNNSVNVDITKSEYVFTVTSVQTHCNDTSLVNIPNYTIYAGVAFYCDETNPPSVVCSKKSTNTDYSCLDFSSGQIPLPELDLE
jgi:hypothetical protein